MEYPDYRQPKIRKKLRTRAERILSMHGAGMTVRDIGRVLEISHTRVRKILLLIEKAQPGTLYHGIGDA
jgi:DNA-binding NarL/FixJ family response regulator